MSSNNPVIKKDEKEGKPVCVSQRELKLRYMMPVGEIYPFFEGLEKGEILASQCSSCGTLYFPPQGACNKCRKQQMTWLNISGDAELVAYTQIFVRPQSFSAEQPYLVGVAKLKQGLKVLARIAGVDPKTVKVGMRLKLSVEKDQSGVPIYVLKQP